MDDITPPQATRWRKSSFSGGSGACVEFRRNDRTIEVRDSKLGPESPILRYTPREMRAMLDGVRAGEFDDLVEGVD
jgi:hypothetical protein